MWLKHLRHSKLSHEPRKLFWEDWKLQVSLLCHFPGWFVWDHPVWGTLGHKLLCRIGTNVKGRMLDHHKGITCSQTFVNHWERLSDSAIFRIYWCAWQMVHIRCRRKETRNRHHDSAKSCWWWRHCRKACLFCLRSVLHFNLSITCRGCQKFSTSRQVHLFMREVKGHSNVANSTSWPLSIQEQALAMQFGPTPKFSWISMPPQHTHTRLSYNAQNSNTE